MNLSPSRQRLPEQEALQWHFELTVNTANIVENYATLTRSETLLPLVGDKAKLQHSPRVTPIVTWCVSPRHSLMPKR
ncbi:hypothetical protein ACLB1M_21435 [Escherichia coli]